MRDGPHPTLDKERASGYSDLAHPVKYMQKQTLVFPGWGSKLSAQTRGPLRLGETVSFPAYLTESLALSCWSFPNPESLPLVSWSSPGLATPRVLSGSLLAPACCVPTPHAAKHQSPVALPFHPSWP